MTIDVHSVSGPLLGRAIIHPSQLIQKKGEFSWIFLGILLERIFWENLGTITASLMTPSLSSAGHVTFEYLLIDPFDHPKMAFSLKQPYWKSTALIGHRGGGAEGATKRDGDPHRRVHIRVRNSSFYITLIFAQIARQRMKMWSEVLMTWSGEYDTLFQNSSLSRCSICRVWRTIDTRHGTSDISWRSDLYHRG